MKKFLLSLLTASLFAGAAYADGSVILDQTTWSVDTTFHAKVGPGTTQTSLRLWNGTNGLNVFYLTIDLTTEGLPMRTTSGGNKVAGTSTVAKMASAHSDENTHYFAGTNGDFYVTSGSATNGSSVIGTPVYAMTVDGEVFRTNDASDYADLGVQFAYEADGSVYICPLNYKQGTATIGNQTVPFKVINNSSVNDAVSLYTSKYYGSTNQTGCAGNCAEVTAKLVDGEEFLAGKAYKMEVTSEVSRTGDLAIPANEFVIHGRGTGDTFVSSLKVGDIVTLDNVTLTSDGKQIYPSCVMSGNISVVQNGVNLRHPTNTERHPRTALGYSEDRTKLVLMIMDGRTGVSIGTTFCEIGDLMLYAGCYDAVNLDGGGSSTLYTEALGIRNHCSDGVERSVSNAIFAVLEAPEDNDVAEISFHDYNPNLPHLGMYSPRIFAFNKYGLCVNTDFSDFTLSCPAELGEIINDGKTLYITGEGCHALTANYGNFSVSIPITVGEASEATLVYPSNIIDEQHPYNVRLYSTIDNQRIDLNPAAATWTSADASIATVNKNGTIEAQSNGNTQIIGTLGDITLTQNVSVENPSALVIPFASPEAIAEWKASKTSISDIAMSALENGIQLDYTVSSTRGTKITVTANSLSYGIPSAIRFRVNPGDAVIKTLTLNLRAANSNDLVKAEFEAIPTDVETAIEVPLADYFNVSDLGIYPMELVSVSLALGDQSKTTHSIKIPGIEAIYESFGGIEDIIIENNGSLKVSIADGVAYLAAPAKAITVVDLYGRVVAKGEGDAILLPQGKGILLLIADGKAAKIVR